MTDPHTPYPLELNPEEFEAAVTQTLTYLCEHLRTLDQQPAADTDIDGGAEIAAKLDVPMPKDGTPIDTILKHLFGDVVPKSYNTAGPGYLAYIPGGGVPLSAVADLIANLINRYVGVWVAAPGLAQIERSVIQWFCQLVGYNDNALGFLSSGGSLANFSAVVTARTNRLPDNFLKGILYVSENVHHSIGKAAKLAGFPKANLRVIPCDERHAIQIDALEQAINDDVRDGWTPFMLVASAGTTNTGAVDNLNALADLAEKHHLWFHIDAAYGGFFLLTERGQQAMRGIERSDSVTLDPHKGLFLPYGTGALIVRNGSALQSAHAGHAEYLPPMQDHPERIDFCTISPELSRDFRGLRVWLPLQVHGTTPFQVNLDEKLDLATWACQELKTIPHIRIVAEPQLSIVVFRWEPPTADTTTIDDINIQLLERINAKQRVHMTGTRLGSDFVIRICVLSFRTHADRMEMALQDIKSAVKELS